MFTAASAVLVLAGAAHRRAAVALVKPIPMLILGARVVHGLRRRRPVDTALLIGAVAFSMTGDRMMYAEEFASDPEVADRRLRDGALAFTAAHLCYLTLARRRGGRVTRSGLLRRAPVLIETSAVVAVRRPEILPVLSGYGPTLASMSAMAATVPACRPGGALFLVSDAVLINRRHLLRGRRARGAAEAVVLSTYCAAQWWLATGLDPACPGWSV
ncbi:YhhN-like protein [Williamsia sterculiae]|uniref:YhhN-like protein n=1 Tax=Williamsia sterculiae TaxID=1344003 RepID=A0A1N7FSH6_9NOCA|nr:YhhN-like protein [Williamsia sterculiae]